MDFARRNRRMQEIKDQSDQVTDKIHDEARTLGALNRAETVDFPGTHKAARSWTQNVHTLKSNLDHQQDLLKAMSQNVKLDDEQHGDSVRDRHRWLLERLKQDVRFFFGIVPDFSDLPADAAAGAKTWDHFSHDVEAELRHVSVSMGDAAGTINIDDIIALLNYRDSMMSELFRALLYQKAVLDWDFKSKRSHADAAMVENFEFLGKMYSKTDHIPARYAPSLVSLFDHGSFSIESKATSAMLSPLQDSLRTLLREMKSLDDGLRNMKFGEQVIIPRDPKSKDPKHKKNEVVAGAHELRDEVTKWFKKCQDAEKSLTEAKAQRHNAEKEQIAQLVSQNESKEKKNQDLQNQVNKLEHENSQLKYENNSLRREKAEVQERNKKMDTEYVPLLRKMEKVQDQSSEAVKVLTADAELLSSMFKNQVSENKSTIEDRDKIVEENRKLHRKLKEEQTKSKFQQDELQKKETLYLRTMAARKSIYDEYQEQKLRIKDAEEKMHQRESDWQEMLQVLQGREDEIRNRQEELNRAHQRISELEEQKKMFMEEFHKSTGRTFNALVMSFRQPAPEITGGEA